MVTVLPFPELPLLVLELLALELLALPALPAGGFAELDFEELHAAASSMSATIAANNLFLPTITNLPPIGRQTRH
jgi:hypothetical protein